MSGFRGVRKSIARATGVHNAFSVQQKNAGAWVVEEHKTPETPVVHDDEELHVLHTAEPEFDGRDRQGRTRVIQRRFNVSVPRARVPEKASTLRDRSER